jgi:uridine phosphorylase
VSALDLCIPPFPNLLWLPGTVVVTTEGINGKLEPCFEQVVLGKTIQRPTKLDDRLTNLALELAKGDGEREDIPCVAGKTVGTDDFYEGQGRMDGAELSYTAEERAEWLQKAYEMGVRNIEMESTCFAAWCHRTGIPGMICCAALLNRMNGDQVTTPAEQLMAWSNNAQEVALRVMEHELNRNQ